MKVVCARSARFPIRHYFYGGAKGVASELSRRLSELYPGLQTAGTHCPPFRDLSDSELDVIARQIDESDADIVWVGLSTPKQERWIAEVRPRLAEVKVLFSVGAAFDFHTGRVPQAPTWMRRNGLEWLFRLTQEPRRLGPRYAYNNPRFIWFAALQLMGLKRFLVSDL